MRAFVFTFLVMFTLIIGFAWYWVAKNPMGFMDNEYPMWKAKADMLNECHVGRLAMIGDSKAMAAVIPDEVGPGVVNLAVGGGALIEALAVSKQIVACPHPPKAVVLSMTFYNLNESTVYWSRTLKFGLMHFSWEEMETIRRMARKYNDTDSHLYGEPTFFDIDARMKNALYASKFPAIYFSAFVRARLNKRYDANQRSYEITLKARGHHLFATASGNWDIDKFVEWQHFHPSAFYESLLSQLIQLYDAHHIPLYFISPPYNSIDVERINPGMRADLAGYLASFEKKSPYFHVIGDVFPPLPPEDFGDLVHPNAKGAKEWSKQLAHILNQAHIEGGHFVSQ